VITWFGWHVPVGVQLLTVAVVTLGLCTLAARVFRTTE
jgi:ABC-2 type transport system permease protein